MKKVDDSFELSATDLVGHLHCRHLTALDRAVAEGVLAKPKVWDPLLEILSERGAAHEQSYIEHLTKAGLDVIRIDGFEVTNEAATETLAAMRRGVPVIVQGALSHQGWYGRADILRRVEGNAGGTRSGLFAGHAASAVEDAHRLDRSQRERAGRLFDLVGEVFENVLFRARC